MSSRLLAPLPTVLLLASTLAPAALAQKPVTADDYTHAAQFLSGNLDALVSGPDRPFWIGDSDQFWIRKSTGGSVEFLLVNAATGMQQPAFDHAKMAAALGSLLHHSVDAHHLPILYLRFSPDLATLTVFAGRSVYTCDRAAVTCSTQDHAHAPWSRNESLSPDGKRAVFIRDWNLWVRDVATGKETQLTHDGVENDGYATDNAGWVSSDAPVVLWSPDSKKIATFQQDQRQDGDMYLVQTKVGHPVLQSCSGPKAGTGLFTSRRCPPDDDGCPSQARPRLEWDSAARLLFPRPGLRGEFDSVSGRERQVDESHWVLLKKGCSS